jgi:hypothetical protein
MGLPKNTLKEAGELLGFSPDAGNENFLTRDRDRLFNRGDYPLYGVPHNKEGSGFLASTRLLCCLRYSHGGMVFGIDQRPIFRFLA